MLEELPAEDILFPFIFSRLAACDLFNVRGCNSDLHSLVSTYFSVSRSLDLAYNKRLTKEAFEIITTSRHHQLRELKLSGLKFLTDDLVRPVLQNNIHLVTVDLSDCHHLTAGILQTLSVSSYQLERLVLRDCHWVTREALDYHSHQQGLAHDNKEVLSQLARHCVRLDPTTRPKPSKPRPRANLCEVELTGCWELNDQVLTNFLANFPQLKVVRLGKIYSVTDLFMSGLAKHCRNLELLDITGCWRVSDQGVSLVGEYCKHLAELRVTDCRDVSEQSLGRLRQRGVKIDKQLDPTFLKLMKIMHEQRHVC